MLQDTTVARSARVHDWLLGGVENYAPDRAAGAALVEVVPGVRQLARSGRAFLRHAVGLLAGSGVAQFLDLGCGLPVLDGNVHEVAQAARPGTRVVYVDVDPVVLAHAFTTLDDNADTLIVGGDIRRPGAIREAIGGFFDWGRPVAVLMASVLDCLPADGADDPDGPEGVVRDWAALLPPGSPVVIQQMVCADAGVRAAVTAVMTGATGGRWGRMAAPGDLGRYAAPLHIKAPGLGDVTRRHPDSPAAPGPLCPSGTAAWGVVSHVPGAVARPGPAGDGGLRSGRGP
ncbi:SAM-dependent methyltransferase [Streptomyces clavuligerus]|uniref:SAM-dependent methyltransferase n=2 Tax=Streptomyces clavuligerus TaxID=1901 RepID=UPI002379385F|nr:SAM-dependent methyltransferase [Streptomyces clavuligerus]WDN55974.1 SAM-dependent methyltransferase [Streptomyces clavuligerus]